jgi:meiotically up-regulated gene 157 (Mug157) protein
MQVMRLTFLFVLALAGLCAAGDNRPEAGKRKFVSAAVEEVITRVAANITDPELALLFTNCFPSTLDTTVTSVTQGDTFVITGDITAMWLRDSTNQILPYVPYAAKDARLAAMIAGVVARHAKSVLHDPYANAFNQAREGGEHQGDLRVPPMTREVFEGKYELDSLMNVLHLARAFLRATNDTTVFTAQWQAAADLIVATVRAQ